MDVMVDLETMGNGFNAAIVQIGAVKFEPFGNGIDESQSPFQINISLKSAMKAGFDVDSDTIIWWMDQSEEARKVITDPPLRNIGEVHGIKDALSAFRYWFSLGNKINGVWAHKDFDLAILAHAYKKTDEWMPWRYRQTMDLRTLTTLHGQPDDISYEGAHIAVNDAKRQALVVQKIFQGAGIKEYKIKRG